MKSTGMPSPAAKPSRLALFWFGIQMVWGALLGVSLQARASELTGAHAIAAYGLLASSGAAVAAVVQIAIGIASDRRRVSGSRRLEFFAAGSVLAAAAVVWFYMASSFAQLVASVLALQIAMNVAIGPYQAVIPDFVAEEHMGTASSWMAALQSLGNAAGALVAALVANGRIAGFAIAGTLLASCAGTASHVRLLALRTVRKEKLQITQAFADLFISRTFIFLGFYTLLGYLFFYVRHALGADVKTTTGVLILIVTAAAALGAVLAARPSSRIDQRALAAAGGVGFIAALVAFLFANGLAAIAGSAAWAGIAWGVFVTADWTLGCRFLPRHALATAMGVWNLAQILPQIVAPLIATAVLSALHALHSDSAARIAFVVAVFEVSAGVAWIWRLPAARVVQQSENALS